MALFVEVKLSTQQKLLRFRRVRALALSLADHHLLCWTGEWGEAGGLSLTPEKFQQMCAEEIANMRVFSFCRSRGIWKVG